MKKIWKTIINRMKNAVTLVKGLANRVKVVAIRTNCAVRLKLAEENGQFVVDHALVFVIAIALGGIALALLTTFLQTDLAPAIKDKVLDFMN